MVRKIEMKNMVYVLLILGFLPSVAGNRIFILRYFFHKFLRAFILSSSRFMILNYSIDFWKRATQLH